MSDQLGSSLAMAPKRAMRRRNPPIRPPETLFTIETATTAGNFPGAGQDDAAWRPTTRRLSPGLDSIGLAWISLDRLGLRLDSLGFFLAFLGFPWLRVGTFQRVTIDRRGIWRFFSPPRPRSRPSGKSDHELEPRARMARRGCGMGTATSRFRACKAHRYCSYSVQSSGRRPACRRKLRYGYRDGRRS